MENRNRPGHSPLLPVGIAMVMLSFPFSFSAGATHWLWVSQPHIAILVATVGIIMISAHTILRVRQGSSR